MAGTKIAYMYAKSLLQLAKENGQAENISTEMNLVANTIADSRELQLLLNNPIVNSSQKKSVLESVFDGKVSEASVNLMRTLVANKRESFLGGVASSYIEQYHVSENIVTAEITTAVPLNDDLKTKAFQIIKKMSDKKVTLVEKVSEDIIGGLIVRIGDKQIDASVKRRLEDFRKELSKNIYTSDN